MCKRANNNGKVIIAYRIITFSQHNIAYSQMQLSPMHKLLKLMTETVTKKSPLPLTDPRDAVPHVRRAVHRCGRSV